MATGLPLGDPPAGEQGCDIERDALPVVQGADFGEVFLLEPGQVGLAKLRDQAAKPGIPDHAPPGLGIVEGVADVVPVELKGPGSNYFSSARITAPTPPVPRPLTPIHRFDPSACRAAWPPVFAPSWPQSGRGSASFPAAGSD